MRRDAGGRRPLDLALELLRQDQSPASIRARRATTAIDIGGEPWSIALGAGAAWVSSGVGLKRIAADGAEATLVSPQPNTLAAFSDGIVWFLDCWGCARASLRTIDASDEREIGSPIRLPR